MVQFTIIVIFCAMLGRVLEARPSGEEDFSNVEMPEKCRGQGFCLDKPSDYPKERMERLLENIKWFEELPEDTGYRQGLPIVDACPADTSNEPIYQIIDESNRVRHVVQIEGKFKQIVDIVKCKFEGSMNSTQGSKHFPSDYFDFYDLTCTQTSHKMNLLVLSLDGNSMEYARPLKSIPVCCSCSYTKKLPPMY